MATYRPAFITYHCQDSDFGHFGIDNVLVLGDIPRGWWVACICSTFSRIQSSYIKTAAGIDKKINEDCTVSESPFISTREVERVPSFS